MNAPASRDPLVLVTGATGYVGGRLVPRLLDAGSVRAPVRDPLRLQGRDWAGRVEVVTGDVLRRRHAGDGAGRRRGRLLPRSTRHGGHDFHAGEFTRTASPAGPRRGAAHHTSTSAAGDPSSALSEHLFAAGHGRRPARGQHARRRISAPPSSSGPGRSDSRMIRFLTQSTCRSWYSPAGSTRARGPLPWPTCYDYLAAALDAPGQRGRVDEIGGATS